MLRLLKTMCGFLACTALGLLTTGCGTGGGAQVRVVNVISNNNNIALDVDINGAKVLTVGTGAVFPSQATPVAYLGVQSGSDVIEAFDTGTTTNPLFSNVTESVSGGSQYTLVLAGSLNNTVHPPTAFLFPDNNTSPTTGNVKFRIIDASAFTPTGGWDIYLEPGGTGINGSPQISGLTYGTDGPGYVSVTDTPQVTVYVTAHGNPTQLFNFTYTETNQEITTLVIQDNASGSFYSQTMLDYTDLN
jgi:uncharacterized protein DUF4397